MNAKHGLGASLGLALVALATPACNLVLGIDKASVDPSLSTTSSTSSSSSSSTGSGGAGPINCEKYCTAIGAACTQANSEYISKDVCLAMCATFDPGQPGDTKGDSLNCRYGHALAAAADPVHECQKAGPLAIDCTAPCSAFCLLDIAFCTPGEGLFPYASAADCKTQCMAYSYLVSADQTDPSSAGDILFLAGDTLNCRVYHLESAYDPAVATNKTTHCPHTAQVSATCVN